MYCFRNVFLLVPDVFRLVCVLLELPILKLMKPLSRREFTFSFFQSNLCLPDNIMALCVGLLLEKDKHKGVLANVVSELYCSY